MSFATTRRFTLQSAVAPGQSVSFAYPDDLGPADFVGYDSMLDNSSAVVIDNNDVWSTAEDEVEFSFGASEITATNNTPVTWRAGGDFFAQIDIPGSRDFLQRERNLADLTSVSDARAALGLGGAGTAFFEARAEAEAAIVGSDVDYLWVGSLAYVRDASGTALETGDGATWSPDGDINVLHWGAQSGGSFDNSPIFHKIMEWVPEGARVSFPEGVWGVSREVDNESGIEIKKDGVELFGEAGRDLTVIRWLDDVDPSGGHNVVKIGGQRTGCGVRGIDIDGNVSRDPTGYNNVAEGLECDGTDCFAIDCYFTGAIGEGLDCDESSGMRVEGCIARDCRGNGLHLSHPDNSYSQVVNSGARNCAFGRADTGSPRVGGIVLRGNFSHITNCWTDDCAQSFAVEPVGGPITISNCTANQQEVSREVIECPADTNDKLYLSNCSFVKPMEGAPAARFGSGVDVYASGCSFLGGGDAALQILDEAKAYISNCEAEGLERSVLIQADGSIIVGGRYPKEVRIGNNRRDCIIGPIDGTEFSEGFPAENNLFLSPKGNRGSGVYGIGARSRQPTWPNTSLNNVDRVGAGIYRTIGSTTDRPGQGVVIFSRRVESGENIELSQILITSAGADGFFFRRAVGGAEESPDWGSWENLRGNRSGDVTSGYIETAPGFFECWVAIAAYDGSTIEQALPVDFVNRSNVVRAQVSYQQGTATDVREAAGIGVGLTHSDEVRVSSDSSGLQMDIIVNVAGFPEGV